ncbi:hypothetical protein EON82_16295 [bacterium]|nr:MAG: hypothetical protein EON82_16295 [bacterium]
MGTPRVRLTPLGSLYQVQGSIWQIQQGRGNLLTDIGTNMHATSRLFPGGSRIRDNRGIDDALRLNLLPHVDGIYREDAIVDSSILEEAEDVDPTDLLGTHKHEDHLGQLHALHPSIRVHVSRAAAGSLHAAHVCGQGLKSETTHYTERRPHPTERGILERPRNGEVLARPLQLVDGPPTDAMLAMWRAAGSDAGLSQSDMIAGGIPFRAHGVDHSVFGAVAYELLTAQGPVLHMGDLRLHGSMGHLTERLISHAEKNRPRLMLLEGTRLGREGEPEVTERACAATISKLVKGAGRRLVVACVGPNHLERLGAFLGAAQRSKRRLVVSPRTMVLLEAMGAADPYYDMSRQPGLALYDPPMSARPRWHKELRERNQHRLIPPEEISKDARRFVLLRAHLSNNDLLDVKPHGALLVYSSSAAYSDHARSEHAALGLWAQMFGMETEGIAFSGSRCDYDPRLNPSGHLSHEDIVEVVDRVRPEILVPHHCAQPEMFKDIAPKGVRVVIPEVGRTITLR